MYVGTANPNRIMHTNITYRQYYMIQTLHIYKYYKQYMYINQYIDTYTNETIDNRNLLYTIQAQKYYHTYITFYLSSQNY